jgi:hypothetical protein
VKGAVAVRLPPSGERPTPASLITLRTGVPQALVSSEATA